jgi:hypothetical protein
VETRFLINLFVNSATELDRITRELWKNIKGDWAILGISMKYLSRFSASNTSTDSYCTRDQARSDVFDYIERFCNRQRRHSYVGNISPVGFEERAIWA